MWAPNHVVQRDAIAESAIVYVELDPLHHVRDGNSRLRCVVNRTSFDDEVYSGRRTVPKTRPSVDIAPQCLDDLRAGRTATHGPSGADPSPMLSWIQSERANAGFVRASTRTGGLVPTESTSQAPSMMRVRDRVMRRPTFGPTAEQAKSTAYSSFRRGARPLPRARIVFVAWDDAQPKRT